MHVTGMSKGKGFAGAIKRWGARRGPMAHGSKFHRSPGTLAAPRSGSRVFPGRKLPGRMGQDRVTVRNLEVVRVDPERNLLLVKGAVPGTRGRLVMVRFGRTLAHGERRIHMPTIPVFNLDGETVGEITLSEAVFGVPMNAGLLHQSVVRHQPTNAWELPVPRPDPKSPGAAENHGVKKGLVGPEPVAFAHRCGATAA